MANGQLMIGRTRRHLPRVTVETLTCEFLGEFEHHGCQVRKLG
jgi:hypothetical protein